MEASAAEGVNRPSIKHIGTTGEIGHLWKSLHSSRVYSKSQFESIKKPGVYWVDVTAEFMNRFNPLSH